MITIYKGSEFNSDFDLFEVNSDNFSSFELNDYYHLFKTTKILILILRGLIKRVYINSNHPNAEFITRLFNSNRYKNKKIGYNSISEITSDLSKVLPTKKFYSPNNIIDCLKLNEKLFFYYNKNLFNSDFDVYETFDTIKPKIAIYKNKRFRIKNIKEQFIIEKIRILTYNRKIYHIITDSPHPNSDITDRELCLPIQFQDKDLFEIGYNSIKSILEVYNLNNPYFYPLKYMKIIPEDKCQNY